ncbi:ribonuclease T2 family protein [Oricola indica]|uniref:ribonuclease T2 family protein n=1 Tax=Oricola indica TaxID=2872591 RepID=UPI003CCBD54F
MRLLIRIAAAFAAGVALAGCDEAGSGGPISTTETVEVPLGTGFDFYVLALSWSPSYCASFGDRANRQQCEADDPFGFVVHGLWPQFTTGYPTECPTDRPLGVSRALSDSMLDIMPSTGLIRHEWREHGTCSGLSQDDYFTATRMAFEAIAIPASFAAASSIRTVDPDTVEDAFVTANPRMPDDAIAVTCDRRYLREVRICLSRDLASFVACPEVDANTCSRDGAVMPAAL